jgi:hypothetical protein
MSIPESHLIQLAPGALSDVCIETDNFISFFSTVWSIIRDDPRSQEALFTSKDAPAGLVLSDLMSAYCQTQVLTALLDGFLGIAKQYHPDLKLPAFVKPADAN